MTLAWHRGDTGYYIAKTGRTTYTAVRSDWGGFWRVAAGGHSVGFGHSLREAKAIAQAREDAVQKHLRTVETHPVFSALSPEARQTIARNAGGL